MNQKSNKMKVHTPSPIEFQGISNSTSLLKKLQQNLEDLSQELQLSNAKNQELNKLIQIVSKQRDYYNEELQKSQNARQLIEDQLNRHKHEQDSKNLLINELKKANRHLNDEIETLKDNLQQTKFLFEAQEQQIERIRKQKNLIENQWNKVIKQVNFKMSRIQKKHEEQQKQNIEMYSNLSLKDKVKKALRKIDRQIKQGEHANSQQKQSHSGKDGHGWGVLKQSPINSTIDYQMQGYSDYT